MSPDSTVYFSSHALRARYVADLDNALVQARITLTQRQWLSRIVSPTVVASDKETVPRVDQIVFDDGNAVAQELAGALLITDAAAEDGPVFLHTLLDALEVFSSREALLGVLNERYRPPHLSRPQWEYQRVETDPFERRMQSIIASHGQGLSALSDHLLLLPSLQTALGHALQVAIRQALPDTSIDVRSHVLQLVRYGAASDHAKPVVVAVKTLAESAFDAFVNVPLGSTARRQLLDAAGRVLTEAQAKPYRDALDGIRARLREPYEQLLERFWSGALSQGETPQQIASQALADSFRHALLMSRHALRISAVELSHVSALLRRNSSDTASRLRVSRPSLAIGSGEPVKLAGMVVIDLSSVSLSGLLVFCARSGFRRFTAIEHVAEYFLSQAGRAEIRACTSLNDHAALEANGQIRLRLDAVGHSLFDSLMDSIMALQKRNLAYVLALPAEPANKAAVVVDDALDVRELIDPGLIALGTFGRWKEVSGDFKQPGSLSDFPRPATAEPHPDTSQQVLPTWIEYLRQIQREIDRLADLYPGIGVCAEGALGRYLTLFSDKALDVRRLWVKSADGNLRNVLILFIERLTGHDSKPLSEACQLVSASSETEAQRAVVGFTIGMLEQMLDLAKSGFRATFAAHVRRSHGGQLRRLDSQLLPRALSVNIRTGLLRLGLRMETRVGELGVKTLGMFEQVLDLPSFSQRSHLADDITEVYSVHVDYQPYQPAAPMADVFVLQQPLDSGGKLVVWSPLGGLHECATPAELEAFINLKLADMATRTQWLDCFSLPERDSIASRISGSLPVKVNLERIDGHFIEHLQGIELDRQVSEVMNAYDTALQWRLDAALTGKLLHSAEIRDNTRSTCNTLSYTVEAALFQAFAPQWLNEASVPDLFTLSTLLLRAYVAQSVDQDFMAGIAGLEQYARDKLAVRLKKDLGDQAPDPDGIIVTLTRYVGAPPAVGEIPSSVPGATLVVNETLTHYAINRFSGVQDGIVSFAFADSATTLRLPDPDYLDALVVTLDVGASYRLLLEQALDEHGPQYSRRLKSFAVQMPPLVLLSAFELKLRGELSDRAWRYIRCVMEMPDGLARLQEEGRDIILSPLQLLAEDGGEADQVVGAYVITALGSTDCPWILYTMLNEELDFKEYASESAMLADIQNNATLQALILERLSPRARKIYDNGGLREPHLPWNTESSFDLAPQPPSPPRLLLEPIFSNVLRYLFGGMRTLLRLAATRSTLTSAEFNRKAYRFLMTLGAEQALVLLPGRLGLLVGAWQSQSWIQASANALHDRKWGEAISEISAAIGVLIGARQDPEDPVEEAAEPTTIHEQSWAEETFAWGNGQLTPYMRNRLARLEATSVSLSDMEKDSLFNVYRDSGSDKQYAAVEGKVYQISLTQSGLRIVNGEALGPCIRLNDDQQWELDIQGGLRGGGGIVTRLGSSSIDAQLEHIFITEAQGIPEIRRLYPDRARRIAEAHLYARNYLHVARNNLQVESSTGQIPARAQKIVADFFGVKTPGEPLLERIRKTLNDLTNELLDRSLSPFSSGRIIVGTNRTGFQGASAFTFTTDVHKRIFLTEQFFRGPSYRLKPPPSGQNGFNAGAHFRTTILLHELSHIANNSLDIAYVESSVPYLDLLFDSGEYYAGVKRRYEKFQQRCLSHLTPREELFKDTTSDEEPRDLRNSDGEAKPLILRITGKNTLDAARSVFYDDADKRAEIILSNADSITLLVTLLGRERFTPTTP